MQVYPKTQLCNYSALSDMMHKNIKRKLNQNPIEKSIPGVCTIMKARNFKHPIY